MRQSLMALLLITMLGGCQATFRKPRNQTYLLDTVRSKVASLRVGMTKEHVKKLLGAPSLIDNRIPNLAVWYYLPDEPTSFALQYPEKLRVIYTGQFYSRYSYETTYATDYNWEF